MWSYILTLGMEILAHIRSYSPIDVPSHVTESKLLSSNIASTYHECGTPYAGADTYDGVSNPFFYSRTYIDVHHSDASRFPADIIAKALADPAINYDNDIDIEELVNS